MMYDEELIQKAIKKWAMRFPYRAHTASCKKRARKAGSAGSHTGKDFMLLCLQTGMKCLCCGARGVKLSRDHIIPLCKGGSNSIDNIQPLCARCNRIKGVNIINYRVGEN